MTAQERQLYLGELQVSTSMTNFGVNSSKLSLNSSVRCYTAGYDGETKEHLCELVQNVMRAGVTGLACNVTLDGSLQRVVISANADVNVTFDHTALGDALGFSNSAVGPAASHTGDRQPRYSWAPSRGLAIRPVALNIWWDEESTTKVTRGKDGTVYSVQGSRLYAGIYGYRTLKEQEVKTGSNTFYESFQKFWADVVHAGRPVRVLFDRNTYDSNTYAEGLMLPPDAAGDDEAASIGPFSGFGTRQIRQYDGFWDVEFSMIKNV